VVFEEDPANTAQLAIIAAELRLPRTAGVARTAKPWETQSVKHRSAAPPALPIFGSSTLGSAARCRRCGPKNAPSGF